MKIRSLQILFLVVFSSAIAAASLESLVMPGPVIEGHSELEEQCRDCHGLFDRAAQRQLCLDCHERIAKDLTTAKGFHALHPEASTAECNHCHGEHKGRKADIVGLQPELFDHNFTDFPLEGVHAAQGCTACHKIKAENYTGSQFNRISYFETPTACFECHGNKDIHQGELGESCSDCHDSTAWKSGQFDHSTTEFQLEGKHFQAACISCHVDQQFTKTASTCIDCHRLDDTHGGALGDECGGCHDSESWQTKFSHFSETQFALESAHKSLTCKNCHVSETEYAGLPVDCEGCHSTDDVHLGRNGPECDSCHNQRGWETRFDHLAETGYELISAHKKQLCTACHTGNLTDPLENTCIGCHALDDPHDETLRLCADCHAQTRWDEALIFHHDLTNFALVGLHRTTTCEQCHETMAFSSTASDCKSCHKADDIHDDALGPECANCHNPVGWSYWLFDHDEQSTFPLSGAHEDLVCKACHKPGTSPGKFSMTCGSCHRADDIHRSAFGQKCDGCHRTDTFLDPRIPN